ncbi:MAG: right-handed parallel beta-helix repeat-containing protein [Phycisphaerales bacterium]|nr:right-handed parallel beta-helix repeat-containing protein [Phycisphaerales bacterium]
MDLTILSGDLDGDGVADGRVLTINTDAVASVPGIQMSDLSIINATGGVYAYDAGGSFVRRCKFTNIDLSVISLRKRPPFTSEFYEISNCEFVEVGRPLNVYAPLGTVVVSDVFMDHTTDSASISADSILINGAVGVDNESEVFTLYEGNCVITNSTFMRNSGSCVQFNGNGIRIADSHFENNTAQYRGGAIDAQAIGYEALIERCTFLDNHSSDGGAIYVNSLSVDINECSFIGNTAGIVAAGTGLGGAAHLRAADLTVEHCDFAGNAGSESGALNLSASTGKVSGCEFYKNGRVYIPGETMHTKGGGGLCIEDGVILVENSVFRENRAREAGGVMVLLGFARGSSVRQCQFYGNYSEVAGGAVATVYRDCRVTTCIFVGNRSGGYAGVVSASGVIRGSEPPTVDSCVMYDNHAPSGVITEAYSRDGIPITNTILAVESPFNLIADGTNLYTPLPASNLVSTNPESIGFVRLPNDGGDGWGDDLSTPDVDEGANDDFGDLRLLPGSPAIDAGDNSAIPLDQYDIDNDGDVTEPITGPLDLDGNPRFVDAPGMPNLYPGTTVGGPIDLGPYEFQGTSCWADVNLDGALSPADFSAWVAAFNANNVRADQNRDGDVTPADFSAWVANYNAGC